MDIRSQVRQLATCITASFCLVLLVSGSADAATRKYVAMPDNSAVLSSSNTAYLSGNNLWKQGDTMTSYVDRLGRKTPVGGIVPKKAFSLPSIGNKFKGLAKRNLAGIAMSAAISTALAGVGWVMEEGTVVKKIEKPIPFDSNYTYWELNFNATSKGASPAEACANAGMSAYVVKGTTSCDLYYPNANAFWGNYPLKKIDKGCPAGSYYSTLTESCAKAATAPLTDADLDLFDPWLNKQSAAWIADFLRSMCAGSIGTLKPAQCFAELEVAAKQLEGPAKVDGGTKTKNSTYTRPDGTMGTRTEAEQTTFELAYGPDYFDYTTKQTTTTTEDGVKTGESTETDGEEVTQEEPKEDTKTEEEEQQEEQPEREASGEPCDVPLACSGDAIDCAVLTQEKALRCAYEKQSDYEKHKTEIQAAVTGAKFEMDDSTEIQIPSFINQGTRFLPASCPADKTFSLRTNGGRTFAFTYEPLCAAATDLGYLIVIAVGAFCVLYVGRSLGGE
ncbi:virulence factor TspB C-terminal domain-related protein [Pseudomonas nicosulfuronedens]|uniref:virulence factor TspB C-terminal domain-related protein n=1 Tax=Pseudomonas nicosulfuronedens TaxID=2571105 RepID=UPI00244823D3|nr:virulence factor TspB C-terminal domain-related protein [Pseudomonas nicosulfuronedens]MDH1008312.1 virulence factor TspB C-terminal domain-related protein [Pseudomonas nicosulfuronedens]MDH1979270.1 virulence factor TspB C-terminal domain-related protein [Pseudomonas nicosulfuronedens]MDH2027282.1 virulence factor TspB C-terminal domain-related protein [Pseudomonas nicosulfuronedens]